MPAEVRVRAFDREALERVIRLTMAELLPGARAESPVDGRHAGRNGAVSVTRTTEALAEAGPTPGCVQISELDLSRALETAFLRFLGRDEVVVLRNADAPLRRMVERLGSMVEARRRTVTEKHVEALIDAYLPADALASVMPDIEADNARAQADFLSAHATLTAEEVARGAGHAAANRSATANRWKGDHRIFAVRVGGRDVYPAFQFRDGQPRAGLRPALEALTDRSGWQIAFWLVTPNSWLDGAAPLERLDDGEAMARAAHHEMEAWIG